MTISQNYSDVQNLGPEVARLDIMEFQVDCTAAGVIVAQPSTKNVPGPYYSQLAEIRGSMTDELTDPELSAAIYFNIKDSSKGNGNLFTSSISMSHLCNSGVPMAFEKGLYRFDPGSKIECVFSLDSDATYGYPAFVTTIKRWSVALVFNQFRQ